MDEKVELKQDKINLISLNSSLGHPQKERVCKLLKICIHSATSLNSHPLCNLLEIFHVTNFQLPQKFVANVLPFGENFGECFKKL